MAITRSFNKVFAPCSTTVLIEDSLGFVDVTFGAVIRVLIVFDRAGLWNQTVVRVGTGTLWEEVSNRHNRVDLHSVREVEFVREAANTLEDLEWPRALLQELGV